MTGRIWLIAGPTASGKSALALRLARTTGGEIVNADALQLYADLRVLTARPSPDEEAQAPHHLFGIADGADGWSVGRWQRAANALIADIGARGRDAIVVGGTGLYLRALTLGLAEVPQIPAVVRRQTDLDFETLGEVAFRARLAALDPLASERIAPGDRQRLTRAWDVQAATGRSLTDHQLTAQGALPPGSWRAVALSPPREALYARCDARLAMMFEQGALEEASRLMSRSLAPSLPIMKAVGVREISRHLRGEADLPTALTAAQRETRRYAKRQMTWIRGQMAGWPRLDGLDPAEHWRQFVALHPALTD